MPAARPLAEVYRRYADEAPSPLHRRIAAGLSGSDDALRAVEAAPARTRQPALILAALHDLVLAGRAPTFTTADAALELLLSRTGAVVATVARRRIQTLETDRCAVLYPLVAEAARRLGAGAVGLVDVGTAGLNPHLDLVRITYSTGQALGDPSSPVQLAARVVGDRAIPATSIPAVVARIGVGPDLLDVSDADDVRWLRACVPPDLPERRTRLDAEIAVAASAPPLLLRGDDALPEAIARVPADALPVVTTTWALSGLRPEGRQQFVQRLRDVGRPVAWVSVEGVGVAPGVPTFGDRPASGHSILGVAVTDGATLQADAVGRCWSRGRILAWLA